MMRAALLRSFYLTSVLAVAACEGGRSVDTRLPAGDDNSPGATVRLTLVRVGDAAGVIQTSNGSLQCAERCEFLRPVGETLELTAVTKEESIFVGWEGACSGSADCQLSLNADTELTARFNPGAPVGAWYAGDGHVHNDHSSDGSFTRQGFEDAGPGTTDIADQVAFASIQGLAWLPLTDHRTFDQHWDPQWTSDQLLLITGEEANGRPHCTVFGHIDTAVQGANPEGAPDLRALQQSIWDVRAQGAVWNQAHPDRSTYDVAADAPVADSPSRASQLGVALAEVFNWAEDPEAEIDYAENRWRRGFRFGVAGASDNHDKVLWPVAGPGSPTTWVFAREQSERAILNGLADARTVVSSGPFGPFPILEADAQGDGVFEALPGDELVVDAGRSITLRITVTRPGINQVLLYGAPGRDDAEQNPVAPVASFQGPEFLAGPQTLTVTAPDSGDAWWYVMVRNQADALAAMTSPIFVSVGDRAIPQPEVAVPADSGSPDDAKLAFGGDHFASFGDVAVAGDHRHLVGEAHGPAATRIVYRRGQGAGPLSDPIVLSEDSTTARFPRIAAQGDKVWVVWQDERAGQIPRRTEIRLRHSEDGGLSWQASEKLSTGGRAMHPAMAITPAGQPVIVWQDNADSLVFDIKALVAGRDAAPVNLSAAGKSPMAANPIDTRSAVLPTSLYPDVAVRGDGLIAVSWHDNRFDLDPLWTGQALDPLTLDIAGCELPDGLDFPSCINGDGTDPDDWEILVATRAPDGNWGDFVNASGSAMLADQHSTVGFTADGTLVVAWNAKDNSGSSGRDLFIRSARSGDDGVSFPPAVDVTDEATPGMARRPTLASDAVGGLLLTWSDSRSDDWRWRIFAAPVTATGFGGETLLTGPGSASFQRHDRGVLTFTSDRLLQRVQRDRRFGVFLLSMP